MRMLARQSPYSGRLLACGGQRYLHFDEPDQEPGPEDFHSGASRALPKFGESKKRLSVKTKKTEMYPFV